MKISRSGIVLLVILFLTVCVAVYFAFTFLQKEDAGFTAADRALGGDGVIEYTDLLGNTITLDQFQGKVRVVTSWATWCPVCQKTLTSMDTVSANYSKEEVVFIAVNRTEQDNKVHSYLDRFGPFESILFVQDSADAFYKLVGAYDMPETLIYDKAGVQVKQLRGTLTAQQLRNEINQVMTTQE